MLATTTPSTVQLASIGDVRIVADPANGVVWGLDPAEPDRRLFIKYVDGFGDVRGINGLYKGDGSDLYRFPQTDIHRLKAEVRKLARAGRLRV